MMKNTFIYGYTTSSVCINNLPKVLEDEKVCKVVSTVGEAGTDYDIRSFFYGTFPKRPYRGCPDEIYDKVYPCLLRYLDMIDRYHRFENKFYPDYFDNFNRVLDFFYAEFVDKKIERVIFLNVMHDGTDVLIYNLAKAMDIPVIITCPSLFADRFYFSYDLEDFGGFSQNPVITPPEPYTLPRQHEKDLFYVRSNLQPFDYPFSTLRRHFKTYRWTAVMFYLKTKSFRKAWQSIIVPESDVDLSAPFVYFPLHYQPEMTTTGLGGRYIDQMLALERISRIIPKDWFIYVKESIHQSFEFRGDWFFERMKALPNIKLVPFEMNTYSLIQHSKFVATITGTAGWEAVSGGKSAVIFGQAWYTNFPGVFQYTETLDPYALANYEIDHDALEGAVSRLISRTGQGVLDPNFIATSAYKDNFDGKKNVHTLAKSLAKIIAHQDAMDTESSELTTKLQEPELVLTARQDTGEPYAP